ncbi:MAG TPA: C40 family peptidase [Acidimicrobiales bacterium]|nr:C40 family peptidase [Acidimicrobiales bacterium]
MKAARRTLLIGVPVALFIIARAAFPMDGLTPAARAEIPAGMVGVYKAAAKRCVGLPWQVLPAIAWTESRYASGTIDRHTGDIAAPVVGPAYDGKDGRPSVGDASQPDGWAHPQGPMGMLPAAWAKYATLAPGRPAGATPSVQNAWDSAYATAHELCGDAPLLVDLNRSIRGHTPDPIHVMGVLLKIARYSRTTDIPDVAALVAAVGAPADPAGGGVSGKGAAVVAAAARMLGVPYVWGAESPTQGFDCSGLVWWSYREAGITVARTTEDLVNAGVPVVNERLQPGDLLFTRGGQITHDFGHVAIYAGGGMEIVAPRSGKSVTVQKVDMKEVQAVRRILA